MDINGNIVDRKIEEFKEHSIISKAKRVMFSENRIDKNITLIPIIKDPDKVKNAVIKVWRLPAEGSGLTIDFRNLPPPNITVNALNGEIKFARNDGRAVMLVLEVEYLDGSTDSFGYTAVGFDVVPSTVGP